MSSEVKKLGIVGVVCLALGIAIGFTLMPSKVQIHETTKEVKVSDTERTRDRDVVRVREKRPDGTEVVRTEFKDHTETDTHTKDSTATESDKTITRGSGLAATLFLKGPITEQTFGVGVSKKVLGPFSVGAFGFTDKSYGLSVGVEF